MSFEIRHCHYHRLLNDPDPPSTLAAFTVYQDGKLVAVVREAFSEPLINEPIANKSYRVDCRAATPELRSAIAEYLPVNPSAYFEDAGWVWSDNGTYEEMPWKR